MPHVAVNMPSGTTALALLPLALLIVGLAVYALVRLARAEYAPYLPKWLWAVIIVVSIPWGALAYLLLARGARAQEDTAPGPRTHHDSVPGPPAVAMPLRPVDDDPMVSTSRLTRDYGSGAGLFGVDLCIPTGAVYGLVGPNGAGKSTLLSILAGVRHADSGTVHVGVPRTAIAVCPDVPEFEPWLTAFEVVDLARHYVAPDLGAEAVWHALETTGLAGAAGRRVAGFSRGMTQRLGLAAALVGDPQLLLLDEPTAALDPAGRAEILDLIAGMRGRRTVLLSSHILADVQRVADHVGVLRAGTLLYQGSTRTLVDEHLAPRWLIRLSGSGEEVATKLRNQPWVRRVDVLSNGDIRLDADTMQHGEHGIPDVLASCRAGLVSCEPLAADLETAFLTLTGTGQSS
jgi:ABC-2 type transport system ATP-binding protein